jgi:hypothetical protein
MKAGGVGDTNEVVAARDRIKAFGVKIGDFDGVAARLERVHARVLQRAGE